MRNAPYEAGASQQEIYRGSLSGINQIIVPIPDGFGHIRMYGVFRYATNSFGTATLVRFGGSASIDSGLSYYSQIITTSGTSQPATGVSSSGSGISLSVVPSTATAGFMTAWEMEVFQPSAQNIARIFMATELRPDGTPSIIERRGMWFNVNVMRQLALISPGDNWDANSFLHVLGER